MRIISILHKISTFRRFKMAGYITEKTMRFYADACQFASKRNFDSCENTIKLRSGNKSVVWIDDDNFVDRENMFCLPLYIRWFLDGWSGRGLRGDFGRLEMCFSFVGQLRQWVAKQIGVIDRVDRGSQNGFSSSTGYISRRKTDSVYRPSIWTAAKRILLIDRVYELPQNRFCPSTGYMSRRKTDSIHRPSIWAAAKRIPSIDRVAGLPQNRFRLSTEYMTSGSLPFVCIVLFLPYFYFINIKNIIV